MRNLHARDRARNRLSLRPFDGQMAVYDGRDRLGSITISEAGEAHAFDLNGARLGSFPDLKNALAAFPAKESGRAA